MKPEETKILADRHLRQEKQREGHAQPKYGSHIQEWFRPKMRKAARELSAEARIRAIRPAEREKPKGTVITVGEGRGFVVEHRGQHLVVTASHCLPWLPSGFGIAYPEEHVYRNTLGPLGAAPTVACECLFIIPSPTWPWLAFPIRRPCPMKQTHTVHFWNTLHRSELLRHRRSPAAFFLACKGNGLDARSSGWKGLMVRSGSQSPRNRLKAACPARRSFQKPVTPSESLQPL